ncbi:SH3 domain-containing protein, partial [Clostridium sp.]|uniref:SH3 domain-containing protein n=1 Tax=Clostridium sp. TaxID=1506 RepID=UPI003216839F
MNKQKISLLLAGCVISYCAISSNVTANAANTDISHSKETNKTIDSSSNKGVTLKTVSLKDANGNVLENANQFDMLDIISTSNGKYLVVTQSGVKGYLSSSDFEIVTNGENSKLENLDKVSKVSNVTTVLNLRQDPSTNSNIIDTMPNNTTLKVIGKQGDWYKVKFNGKLGFVYGLFTDENEASNQKIGNTTVDQAKKNIVNNQIQKNKKQSYQDTLKGMINEAKAKKQAKQAPSKSTVKLDKSDVEMYTSAKRGTVDINSGWLNMRSGASINDKETGKLDKNANVTVLGHDGNWYLVRTADGQEGFVFGQYINVNQDNTKHQAPSHKTETPSQGDHHDVVKPIHPSDDKHDVVKPIEPSKPVKPTEPTKPVKPTDDHGHDTTTDPGKDKPVKPVEPTKPAVINNAPVLKASNLTINQGEKFTDAMLKATAQDKE